VVNNGLLCARVARRADRWVICKYSQIARNTRAHHRYRVISPRRVDSFHVSTQDERIARAEEIAWVRIFLSAGLVK
jgi:hypothetical protein